MKILQSFIALMIASIIVLTALSCEKEEGEGGSSSITGKVYVRQYNFDFTILLDEYAATDENVFIVYGDDIVYSDKTSTYYDGTYRFDYLREGKYTIFSYSNDSAIYPLKRDVPVLREVSINGRNKKIIADPIVILK